MDQARPQRKSSTPLAKRPPAPPPLSAGPQRKAPPHPAGKKMPPRPPGTRPPQLRPPTAAREHIPVGEEDFEDTIEEATPILLNWESKDSTYEEDTYVIGSKKYPHPQQKRQQFRSKSQRSFTPISKAQQTSSTISPLTQEASTSSPKTQQLSPPSPKMQQVSSTLSMPPVPQTQAPQPVQKKKTGVFGRLFGQRDDDDDDEFDFNISAPTNFHQVDGSKDGLKLNEIPDLESQTTAQGAKKKKDNSNIKPKALLPNEHRVDLEVLKQRMKDMESKPWDLSLVDYWSTRSFPIESWIEGENDTGVYSLAAKEVALSKGYHIEESIKSTTHNVQCDYDCVTCKDVPVLYADKDIPYYELFFADNPHENYLVESNTQPLMVSIMKVGEICRVLIWSKKENRRVLVYPENYLKTLKATVPELK